METDLEVDGGDDPNFDHHRQASATLTEEPTCQAQTQSNNTNGAVPEDVRHTLHEPNDESIDMFSDGEDQPNFHSDFRKKRRVEKTYSNNSHSQCKQILSKVEKESIYGVEETLKNGSLCTDCFSSCINACMERKNVKLAMPLLRQLCKELEELEGSNAVQVYPAYTSKDRWKPVIVLLEQKFSRGKYDDFKGLSLYRRRFDLVSLDTAKVMNSKTFSRNRIRPSRQREVEAALKAKQLTKSNSNITFISTCSVRSKAGIPVNEDCVVIGCLLKDFIPFDEEPFPTDIPTSDGPVGIDVREIFCIQCTNGKEKRYIHNTEPKANTYNEKLLMGAEIRSLGTLHSGTIGGFVKSRDKRTLGFLTCAHVVFASVDPKDATKKLLNASVEAYKTEITQPASCYQPGHRNECGRSQICGTVADYKFDRGSEDKPGIDAALVELANRKPEPNAFVQLEENEELRSAGYSKTKQPIFNGEIIDVAQIGDDQNIVKVGAASGFTTGVIVSETASSHLPKTRKMTMPNKEIAEMENMTEIRSLPGRSGGPFAMLGDSGCLVFSKHNDDLKCIGMLIAVTDYGTALMSPIKPILTALDVEICTKYMNETIPSIPDDSEENGAHELESTSSKNGKDGSVNISTSQDWATGNEDTSVECTYQACAKAENMQKHTRADSTNCIYSRTYEHKPMTQDSSMDDSAN